MRIHVISDDSFFILGCDAIYTKNGYKTNIITPKRALTCDLLNELNDDDIVLVDVSKHKVAHAILSRITCFGVRTLLFLEFPRKRYQETVWLSLSISKKIPISLLLPITEKTREDVQKKIRPLTAREKDVIAKILNGESLMEISKDLGVSVKTIYAHRRNALKKVGLTHVFSIHYIGYQNYITGQNL